MNRYVLPMPGFARLCVLLAGALLLSSCKDANAPVPNITVTPGTAELDVGATTQFTALGGGSAVVWSSSQPDVASVVPQTGFVQALKRGQSTITASAGGASASATVTVLAPAAIALSAPTADFAVLVGAGDPAPKTVTVTNSGDRSLVGVTLGTIAYGQGQPTGWLTTTASSSNPPLTVTLTPRVGTLGRGTYTAIVPVQSNGVANSPQNIAVTFNIQAPASIALSRTSVSIPAIPAETKTEVVNITNGGDVPLTGLSAAITYTPAPPQNWLTATLSSTSAPSTLTLVANSGTLAVGTYTATVRVASSLAGVAARDVTVQLVVSPGPSIVFAPTQVTVNAVNGTNALATTVQISNGGGGTLSSLSLGTITYAAGATNWLTPQLSGATAPATITLNFASSALGTGTYTATLPVLSTVASNSPNNLSVTLTVGPPPNLALNPTSVGFSAWGNQVSLPGAQAVQITNSGNSVSLPGLAAAISYSAGSGWLSASFQNGTTSTPATLLLQPNTTNLNDGVYTATVTVSTTAAGVAPKVVNVQYTVQAFSLRIYPGLNGCSSSCHSTPNTSAATATQWYNQMQPYFGNMMCRIIPGGACTSHTTKVSSSFGATISSWYNAGAPNR